jgi:hypothetical protein
MARPSKLLIGPQQCVTGLKEVVLTLGQIRELDEIGKREDKTRIKAESLPDWFQKLCREKNPIQPISHKLPFKLSGYTHNMVLEPAYRKEQDTRARKMQLSSAVATNRANARDRTEALDAIRGKMEREEPLDPEEQEAVDAASRNLVPADEKRAYRERLAAKLAAVTAPVPRSAREMRVEVERLCKKYSYSPVEALIEIATNPPKDADGNSIIPLDEIIGIHKMLLPYTAPQMSSVRVSDQAGGSIVVQVKRIDFNKAPAGAPVLAPVADGGNNDVGDSWKLTVGRKTLADAMDHRPIAKDTIARNLSVATPPLPPVNRDVAPPPMRVIGADPNDVSATNGE